MVETTNTKKSGRKRAIITGGVLLGAGALVTAAAFTDFALLDLNGDGGFGGVENAYNIQVSTGQENTVPDVSTWVEANPNSEAVAPIEGADALIPGGAPIYVNLPVLNDSASMASSLDLVLHNVTATVETPEGAAIDIAAANEAYAKLIRFQVAQVDDASTVPTDWVTPTGLAFDTNGAVPSVALSDLDPSAGSIIVVKVWLEEGQTQAETNLANGGTVQVQARFDGESKN